MQKRVLERVRALFVIAALMGAASGYGQESSAVPCREALRPVLLQANPDRALLPAIQLLCEQQASAGDPDALYQLSLLHLGLSDWQPDKAVPMIRRAAGRGVPEAQYWLAWQRESGPLLEHDAELALHWYQQAADQEHRLALGRLADVYANGELGVVANMKQASQYRARAARCNSQ